MVTIKLLTDLPDAILYIILTYVEGPTNTGPVLCRSIASLCSSLHHQVERDRDGLWEIILREYNQSSNDTKSSIANRSPVFLFSAQQESAYNQRRRRRQSKGLRQTTVKQDVIYSHKSACDRTESAILQLSEMAHDKHHPLSLARLRAIFRDLGPTLRINQRAKIGGTFLVEVVRARYVSDSVILRCVKELIEVRKADPNVPAAEGHPGYEGSSLPPLVVAAGRGLPTVVKYLLHAGASIHDKGTSRFRLYSKPTKTVSGTYTPLDFSKAMKDAEVSHGATGEDLRGLDECIRLLTKAAEMEERKKLRTEQMRDVVGSVHAVSEKKLKTR